MTFVNLFPKSTITVMLKNIFAGFLRRYFEQIELTVSNIVGGGPGMGGGGKGVTKCRGIRA